jgi:hypothetical protein
MGTGQALWPDRLWLAFARTEVTGEADLTPLGLGKRSLHNAAHRGEAYAAAVGRLKDLPDEERTSLLDVILMTLVGADDSDAGPFQLLSWDEARGIARDGRLTLYPHTVTYPVLSKCSDEKVEKEVIESCAAVERQTGRAPMIFAYPNGRPQDFDERAKAVLRRSAYGGHSRRSKASQIRIPTRLPSPASRSEATSPSHAFVSLSRARSIAAPAWTDAIAMEHWCGHGMGCRREHA